MKFNSTENNRNKNRDNHRHQTVKRGGEAKNFKNIRRAEPSEPTVPLREDRLEGRNPVIEALRAGRQIDKLWVLENKGEQKIDGGLAKIINMAKETDAIIMPTGKANLDKMSETHAHQGVIAQVAVLPYVEIDDIINSAHSKGEDPFIIIADEIQDSYNLGAILRIAEAAGVHGVIFPKRRQVTLDAITAKASAGAVNYVPCARVNNLVQAIDELKKHGVWIAGLAMDGETIFANKKMLGPIALVVGNEGKGISQLVSKNCDFMVSIPMQGVLNSLNAAVATGIAVFETLRLRTLN